MGQAGWQSGFFFKIQNTHLEGWMTHFNFLCGSAIATVRERCAHSIKNENSPAFTHLMRHAFHSPFAWLMSWRQTDRQTNRQTPARLRCFPTYTPKSWRVLRAHGGRFKTLGSKLAHGYQGYLSIHHLGRYSYLLTYWQHHIVHHDVHQKSSHR